MQNSDCMIISLLHGQRLKLAVLPLNKYGMSMWFGNMQNIKNKIQF